MKIPRVEVISIGDELTSGVRLDTNSQWLSKRLEELGLKVIFQTTICDDIADQESAFQIAAERADIVIMTGGLGPTADDVTRHAIATVGKVELKLNQSVLDHILGMYQSRGLEMPPNNEIQAWFPEGSSVIPNPEGTAPGIEFQLIGKTPDLSFHLFAMPGVPAEMKQMWDQSVEPSIRREFGIEGTTHHHTLHCFGTGESAIEMMLPKMIERGRDPLVGITASAATISLRVSTRNQSIEKCMEAMQPTIEEISSTLGNLVYGENGQQLEDCVVDRFSKAGKKIAVVDFGLHGSVASKLSQTDRDNLVLHASETVHDDDCVIDLSAIADRHFHGRPVDLVAVIGHVDRNPARVQRGESFFDLWLMTPAEQIQSQIRFSGHSAWREVRAVKDVLNILRLYEI